MVNPVKVFKKGRELIDDFSDEIGDYLETGAEYLQRLGGRPIDVDNVVKNSLSTKFNRQAEIEQVKSKTQTKNLKQQEAYINFVKEATQRRGQQIRDYIADDYDFGRALELAQQITKNTSQGTNFKNLDDYPEFIDSFANVYKNKANDKESYDKFSLIYDTLNPKNRADQLSRFEDDMLASGLIKEIVKPKDAIKSLRDKGINMRGYDYGGSTPGYAYEYLYKDLAKVVEDYRNEFVKKYGQEPIGRSFTRESFYDFVKQKNNYVKNYFDQLGTKNPNRIEGSIAPQDLKELKVVFKDTKTQYPDQMGSFDPGTELSLKKPRASDYVADYVPGDVRWNDGSIIGRTSQDYKDIKNFKDQILEFAEPGDNIANKSTFNSIVSTNLDNQINRMINKQILKGVEPDQAVTNAVNVLNKADPKSMPKIYDLLKRKSNIQSRVQQARDKGLTTDIVDDVSLAHVVDVSEDYRLALDLDNLFLAPVQSNIRQYNFYDKKLRDLQSLLASDNLTPGVRQTITDQVDDLGKQLEFEGIVTDVGYGRVGKARTPDEVAKMYDDQVDFYMAQPEDRLYTADMNERIKQGAQGPGFNKGGEIRPNITVEFGEPEEDSGMMDYLQDKAESFDRGLQTFVDEELDGNPARAVPVTIGNMLKAPGNLADSIRSKMDTVNQNIDKAQDVLELERLEALGSGDEEKFNQIVQQQEMLDRSRVSDFDKYVNFVTGPLDVFDFFFGEDLGNAYQNMFTDEDDTTLYLDPTGIFSDKKYTIEADSTFGKVVGAARTLGLTAAEVMLLFTPYQLLKLRKLDTSKLKKILAGAVNIGVPAAGFTYGYSSLPKNFQEAQEGLKQSTEAATGPTEPVQDFKKLQEAERDANVGVEMYNMKADGGLIEDELPLEFLENRDYAQTRLSRGGDPGQFTNPTSLALEEDFDARDILNEPGYESIEELDELFDITKKENRFIPRDDLAVQVAGGKGEGIKYILSNVPDWVRKGKERIQMGVDKLLPGPDTPTTGTDLVEGGPFANVRFDEATDGLTPLTKQEPGQIFYQQMEAELLQGPKVFKDKQAFFDYMQARNIGKVEVMDSEIERVIDSLTQKNMPITRETLIGVLRESPVRFVQSKGYGFLSNTLDGQQRGLKYSGYKEAGEIEGTSRERVLFVDPKDLRGDPGNVPSSVSAHNWEEPYTIAWSRLSDRDLGGAYGGKTVTFADEIQSDIFQASQKMAGKLAAKVKYMADNNVPLDKIDNDIQKELLAYFGDRKHVFRESLPSAAALKQEYDQLMSLQAQLRELANTPVPDMTDAMIEAAKKVQFQQADILDNLTQKLNLDLNRYLFPNLPFKLRGQWADASIKRDIYEAAYRKFVLKDPNATDYYAVTPANLVTKRYSHEGTTATPAADRAADKQRRIQSWVSGGMEGDIGSSRYPGVGMYEFYGGPGADVVTESGKHYTSEIEKILKRIARENNVPLEVLPVRTGDRSAEVFNVVDRNTGEILGSGNTGRQADAIANDIIANSDRKVIVQRAEGFDTTDSFGIELTPSMAEAFKAYMAKGGYVNEEILLPYGD